MITQAMFERLIIVVLFLSFLLFGLIVSGKLKADDYKSSYLPVPKEIQYVVMTVDEYNEMKNRKCK